MRMRFFLMAAGLMVIMALSVCSSNSKLTRIDPGIPVSPSGYWNETDILIVCEYLINDCLNSPVVDQAIRAMEGKTPVVVVGTFGNESDEDIDTSIISGIMEMTIFNSEKMNCVPGENAEDEPGADFLLTGTVRTSVDHINNQTVRTYCVNAEMTTIETNESIWTGLYSDVKKVIARSRVRT